MPGQSRETVSTDPMEVPNPEQTEALSPETVKCPKKADTPEPTIDFTSQSIKAASPELQVDAIESIKENIQEIEDISDTVTATNMEPSNLHLSTMDHFICKILNETWKNFFPYIHTLLFSTWMMLQPSLGSLVVVTCAMFGICSLNESVVTELCYLSSAVQRYLSMFTENFFNTPLISQEDLNIQIPHLI